MIKEALRSTWRNIKSFISLFLFIFFTVAIFSAMITSSLQNNIAVNQLQKYSGTYDFQLNSQLLDLKYINESQQDLLDSKTPSQKFYGQILNDMNPFEKNLIEGESEEYNNFTLGDLKNYLLESNIRWSKTSKFTLVIPKSLSSDSSLSTDSNWKIYWTLLIANYSSSYVGDTEDRQNNSYYMSIDGLENFILYELLENDDSPLYKSTSSDEPKLSIYNKPYISYEHKFYYVEKPNTKIKYYYVIQSAANNFQFSNKDIPNLNDIHNITLPTNFYSRNNINRVLTINQEINPIMLDDNVFINQQFGIKNNFNLNGNINFGGYNYQITNYASSISNLYPFTQNINSINEKINNSGLKDSTYVYMNNNSYFNLKNHLDGSENSRNVSDTTIYLKLNGIAPNKKNTLMLGYTNSIFSNYFINNSKVFLSYSSSPAGEIALNLQILLIIELIVSILALGVVFTILLFFIKKFVEKNYTKIGILKALGYYNKKIAIIFSVPLSIVLILAFFTGYFASIPFQMFLSNTTMYSVGANLKLYYHNNQIILFCFIYCPIIFILLIYFSTIIIVNKNILKLIYNIDMSSRRPMKYKRRIVKKQINKSAFLIRLSFSFASKSMSKWLFIFMVSTFSIFLILFEFNVNVFSDDYINSQFDYYNKDVKVISSNNIDQLHYLTNSTNTYFNNTSIEQNTYKWISSDQAKQDMVQDKLTKYNEPINIPKPDQALLYIFFGIEPYITKEKLQSVFGNATNLFYLKQNEYISSIDIYKIINMTMNDPTNSSDEKKVPVWKWIMDHWNLVENFLKKNQPSGISSSTLEFYLIKFKSFLTDLVNYNSISYGNYPNLFMGNYKVYDSNYEEPIISSQLLWGSSYTSKIYQLLNDVQIQAMNTSTTNQFEKFFNLQIDKQTLQNTLDKLNTTYIPNIPLPVIVSNSIASAGNFKIGSVINFNINVENEYIPIQLKVIAISTNDFSSENIYTSYNLLNDFIKHNIEKKYDLPPSDIPDYYNTLLSKGDAKNHDILNIFRNLSIFSLYQNSYKYHDPSTKKIISDTDLGPFASGYINLSNTSLTELTSMNSILSINILKNMFTTSFEGLTEQMIMGEIITAIIDLFIIFSLITIVLDDNRRIILTLKALGYSTFKVCLTVFGFYFFVMLAGFPIASLLVYFIWKIILKYIFLLSGLMFIVKFSFLFFVLTAIITIVIILLNFAKGAININNENISSVTDY